MPIQRARSLLDSHAEAYPGVAAWMAGVHQQAHINGEVRTLYGRHRYVPNDYSASDALAAETRRQAVNTIVQGSAADLMKMALVRLHDALPGDVRMLLRVHDSVLLEVPAGVVEETRRIVHNAMETLPDGFSVPLAVRPSVFRSSAGPDPGHFVRLGRIRRSTLRVVVLRVAAQ